MTCQGSPRVRQSALDLGGKAKCSEYTKAVIDHL
jgi:hypothetical protein